MLKQFYKYIAASLFAGIIASCSSDPVVDAPPIEGDVPVELSGMLTRALGDTGDSGDGQLITTGYPLEAYSTNGVNFFLTARTVDAPVSNYFINRPITIGDHGKDQGRNKLDGNVYYPLGKKAINLFAHTVAADANGYITLTAGTERGNDVLLGKGTDANGTTPKSGQSDDPVKYITFKHLMTRVDVKIEVDGSVEDTKPTKVTMRFSRSGANGPIVNRGTYNIFNGGNATNNASAEYSFSDITTTAQTHYLVPNGANLSNYNEQILSYLKIDDYVATIEDLTPIRFPQTDKGNDFILSPGLAYDLTFKINRLKITEIKLTLKDWNIQGGTSEWGYEPKTLTLNTGDEYKVTDDDSKITKMVLKYAYGGNTYQYIGEGRLDGGANKIDFVTLPDKLSAIEAGKLTADLYTEDGLLADNVEINPSGIDGLNVVKLGKYGMKKNGDVLEISTPLQFTLMANDRGKPEAQKYLLTKGLDMGNTAVSIITPSTFPAGSVLDGAGHDILNLNINGNGLFTENSGTLKNFRIASGLIKGSGTDAIGAVCQTNSGKIEAVANGANIEPASGQTIAGGICGINSTGGTIVAAVNTGNVSGGTTVGGIVGDNKNTTAGAITACLNVGMLNKGATALGGIAGASVSGTSIVNSCFWLTGTARKNQAVSGELAIGDNPADAAANSADLVASVIRGNETIDKLNTALTAVSSPWKFEMDKNRSSWPITKPKP